MIETERFQKVMEENFQHKMQDIRLGRLGSPEDVADACVFLGADLSSYITGQVLGVDGSLKI